MKLTDLTIPKGTIVKVNGLPFELTTDAMVSGREENYRLSFSHFEHASMATDDKPAADSHGIVRKALEYARHELTTLHGLVAADGEAKGETFTIDTTATTTMIDEAITAIS